MKKAFKITAFSLIILSLLVLTGGFLFINNVMSTTKNITFDKEKLITSSVQINLYDNNDTEINKNSALLKPVVKIEELPSFVGDSFVSIEDKRFYDHKGLDYKRIIKATFNNITSRSLKEGASTISQQLIKNTHLTNEKTFKRKAKEMALTRKLEKAFSKKDILETYLNVIYFGEGAYGIENASITYFGVETKDLEIHQAATLAGLIKSPSRFSPIYKPENAIARRNIVLRQMFLNGKINESQYEEAKNKDLDLNYHKINKNSSYDLYNKKVLEEVAKILNLNEKDTAVSGLNVYTYLEKDIQDTLELVINDNNYYEENNYGNIADGLGIVINNKNYGVSAFAGKSKYDLTNFTRQPGSTLKPLISYAPAIETGLLHTSSVIYDEAINYNGYSPKNVGGTYHGYISVKDSISKSLNIPAIKAIDYVGLEKSKRFAEKAGIKFHENDLGYAVALGGLTKGNTLKEITNSFLPFANSGQYKEAKFVKKITDSNGKTIYENILPTHKIMSEDTAYLITDTLIDGVKQGTSMRLKNLPYDVAGKTGTVAVPNTNFNTDAYSVAYTTNHTMGVWLGNYSNDKEYQLKGSNNGGTYATSIIRDTFIDIYKNNTPEDFIVPDSVIELDIDIKALEEDHIVKLATEHCPERYKKKALFAKRYIPNEISDAFSNLSSDDFDVTYTNGIAVITFTPKDYLEYEIIKTFNGKEEVIKHIQNQKEKYAFADEDLLDKSKYSYKLKIINTHSNIYNTTDNIIIITNKNNKFNKLFDNNNTQNSQFNKWFYQTF